MRLLSAVLIWGLLFGVGASADTLRLINGATLHGTYLGGDTRQVRFMGPDGVPKSYSITSIQAIEFGSTQAAATTRQPAPAHVQTAAPVSTAAARTRSVTIPAGTAITVRTIDPIDTKTAAIGERFRASIDDPIVIGERTVIPRGADCTLQVVNAETGGKLKGSAELALKLYDISVDGKAYDVSTSYAEMKTKGEGKKTLRNSALVAGIGAVIGGIAAGGKGAAIGAAAGAGAGVAGSAIKGPRLQVPPESRLTFELREALPLD